MGTCKLRNGKNEKERKETKRKKTKRKQGEKQRKETKKNETQKNPRRFMCWSMYLLTLSLHVRKARKNVHCI